MKSPAFLYYPALLILSLLVGCSSPYYADRGAAFGGVAGALTGAAVGHASGNTGAGAVIGGAVGALTGAAIGDSIDADIARNQALVEARMGRQMRGAVTPHDVVAMAQAGLSDGVIVTHIRAYGMAQPPQAADAILLRQNGVSDFVIQAMYEPAPAQVVVPARPAPVIVEEYHYVPYHRPYWYHHHHHHHPSVSWHFDFGHH